MPALVQKRRERAAIAGEERRRAKGRARAVVVEARSLRDSLPAPWPWLRLVRRTLGDAERKRIDRAQHGQTAPSQEPDIVPLRQRLRHAERRLEGLRPGGVGVVALIVVALHDGELRLPAAQRLPQQPPAHSGLAEGGAAAEPKPHRECVVRRPAVPGPGIAVQQVHFQERLAGRVDRAGLRASPEHARRREPGERRRHHIGRLVGDALGVARPEAIEASHRIQRGRADLAPQPPTPGGARVAHEPGRAVEHLAERDAAERRVDEVVHRRQVGLAEILPGAAAEGGQRRRLVEAQAVGAARGEVVVPLVRMTELIDGEVVEIPDPPVLHVGPPRLRRDLRRDLAADQVRGLVDDVDHRGLKQRPAHAARRAALAGAPFDDPGRWLLARVPGATSLPRFDRSRRPRPWTPAGPPVPG